MRILALLIVSVLNASCAKAEGTTVDSQGEMTGGFSGDATTALFVDPEAVKSEREEFKGKLHSIGRGGRDKRILYQEYVPVIGANGVLGGIEELWPKCHSEGHDLGKVIYAELRDVGTALRVCRDGCYSGCMHGVLMEAFSGARASADADPERHVDVETVKTMMDTICKEKTMSASYSPGDCAHATGHALMVLADYAIDDAIGWCEEFSVAAMDYYCATGAYMEYVTDRDRADASDKTKSLFYPCDRGKYPAACARYKMAHIVARHVKNVTTMRKLIQECSKLTGSHRIGCVHGLGNGFMPLIVRGNIELSDVCLVRGMTDDEKIVCIEGAMERMAKYHPGRAEEVCSGSDVPGRARDICEAAVSQGMYNMEKDFTVYLR